MRTTLTLDPDVARRLGEEQRRTKKSLKEVVNEALRIGLAMKDKPRKLPPFKIRVHEGGFRAGVDPQRLNQLLDEMDVGEFVARPSRDRRRP